MTKPMNRVNSAQGKPLTGRTVLFGLLGFFAVVVGMNIFMARTAIVSFDGQVEKDAYRGGLHFNDKIDQARQEERLGWQSAIKVEGGTMIVTLSDKAGRALSGAQLTAQLWHKTADEMDVPLTFQTAAPGRYVADISAVKEGRWELRLAAKRGDDITRFRQTIALTNG